MRIGNNPEKEKNQKNVLKPHRVVMVFYIPNSNEDYYTNLHLVLEKSIESLINTVNLETTAITLINNCSSEKIDLVIDKYIKFIDKYVFYSENKGKVYAVVNEVRGVFEPFVTITDADVLFYSGWEKAVFSIFKNYKKAGVVSPLPVPHCAFVKNSIVFFDGFFNKIKYGSILNSSDTDLFIQGINNSAIFRRRNYEYWDKKQLYLDKNPIAIIGATHFVATYKTKLFRNVYSFPEYKFKPAYEDDFIDVLPEKNGMYRLSTSKTYAYHIGNNLDEISNRHTYSNDEIIETSYFIDLIKDTKVLMLFNNFKIAIGKAIMKYIWNK